MTVANKKVAYVLSYRSPEYIRTQNIVDALKQLPEVQLYLAKNRCTNILRYFDTLLQLLWLRLRHNPDIYILGFRGHEIYWPVRVLTWGRPLIFDSLMSPYGALKQERKGGTLGIAVSKIVYLAERAILKNCDRVLTDTNNHVDYFCETFGLAKDNIIALPMSAVEDAPTDKSHVELSLLPAAWRQHEERLKVLFYGSFLPLHGVDVILEAIAQIDQSKFWIHFIGGGGKRLQHFHQQVQRLGITNISHETWVSFDKLLKHYIPYADICLGGPFGNTPQSRRVITGKTVQCLAQARTTMIGKIDNEFALQNHKNCLLVEQGNPSAIRDALLWALQQREQLTDIGNNGRAFYLEHFSSAQLKNILQQLLASS